MNGGDWELYDMANDPTELNDLAKTMPEKVEELSRLYQEFVRTMNKNDNVTKQN